MEQEAQFKIICFMSKYVFWIRSFPSFYVYMLYSPDQAAFDSNHQIHTKII